MGQRLAGVVIERVGGDAVVGRVQLHVIVEHGALGVGVVLAPVGAEAVLTVDELSAPEEIGRVVEAVIIETVGVEGLSAMAQHDVLAGLHHLAHAVVPGVVTGQRQRVALPEPHMAEGAERVGGLEIIGTVAHQCGALVTELHMSLGNLRLGIGTVHIILQHVGMDEVDAVVNSRTASPLPRGGNGAQQAKDKQA